MQCAHSFLKVCMKNNNDSVKIDINLNGIDEWSLERIQGIIMLNIKIMSDFFLHSLKFITIENAKTQYMNI